MMQELLNFFPCKNIISETDNFSNYEIKFIASFDYDAVKAFSKSIYDDFNSSLNALGYEWSFEIEENNYLDNC